VRIEDVVRLDFGTFVRPAEETGTGAPRVEHVLGYLARTPIGGLLVDTGIGECDAETEAWYRPRRVPLEQALAGAGAGLDDVDVVVNCHLHFDHIGGNPALAGRPFVAQRRELDAARAGGYTVESLVDVPGALWELLDGQAELARGVHVIPTPGHVAGHQSVVLHCEDGTVVVAGQAHDTASAWSADVLAAHAAAQGHQPPLPEPSPWMQRLLAFDPRRVVFAHDAAVWIP
jgi:N-acyl homoserine lactone hydrolase